jgi:hypothetical protein
MGEECKLGLITVPQIAAENSGTFLSKPAARVSLGKFHRWAPALCLTLLSILYLVPTCVRAAREKLWFDEILTFDAASLMPRLGTLWSFLKEVGASPPLGYVLAAGSEVIFGRNEFGARLPSVIAFWTMALCLYVYLSRRLPWPFAIAGMLLTVLTAAGRYSYEARPYALVLALAGIALVAWQDAAEGRRRRVALVTLGLALMAALLSHPMAVTLVLPFLAGELARTVQRKRVDWPVWCAFASATPAILVLRALKNAGHFDTYLRFDGSVRWHIVTTYLQILRPAVAALGLAFFLVVVLRKQTANTPEYSRGMRAYEIAALVGFALIPFAAVPLSTFGGHYFLRYSLNCIIGLAGLLVVLLFRVGGANRLSGAAVLIVFAVCFAIVQFLPENMRPDAGLKILNTSEEIRPFLERMPSDAPIILCRATTFVELEHYSGPQLAARLYYLTEPAVAAAIDGDILLEVTGPPLAQFFPFRAHWADYHSFIATHKRFYVVQPIRNIAREYFAGRIGLQYRETADHFPYYEASVR